MSDEKTKLHWSDWAVYAVALAGIYLLIGTLFFYSGKEKLFGSGGMPDGLAKQFSGTFLDTVPGLDASWRILGVFEFAVFLLTTASILTLEFLPHKKKPLLLTGLGLSLLTFAMLGVGQNAVGQNDGVASLFGYAGATGVLLFLVLQMPPYRGPNWISGRAPDH
jgi:hypothetical protein